MSASLPKSAFANAPFMPAVLSGEAFAAGPLVIPAPPDSLLRRVSERHAAKVAKMATAEKIAMQVRAAALLHPAPTVATAPAPAPAAARVHKPEARPAPAAPVAAAADPRAALLAQLAATKDNAERYRLAEQINALPWPGEF